MPAETYGVRCEKLAQEIEAQGAGAVAALEDGAQGMIQFGRFDFC